MLDVMLSGKMQLSVFNLGVAISPLTQVAVFQDGNIIDLGLYKLQVVGLVAAIHVPPGAIGLMMGYMYKAPFHARAVLFLSMRC
jgi:hypothetical protein